MNHILMRHATATLCGRQLDTVGPSHGHLVVPERLAPLDANCKLCLAEWRSVSERKREIVESDAPPPDEMGGAA